MDEWLETSYKLSPVIYLESNKRVLKKRKRLSDKEKYYNWTSTIDKEKNGSVPASTPDISPLQGKKGRKLTILEAQNEQN